MPDIAATTETVVKKPVSFRRLKIAWTVFFAMLTVALGLLWARSYGQTDSIYYMNTRFGMVNATTWRGNLCCAFQGFRNRLPGQIRKWDITSETRGPHGENIFGGRRVEGLQLRCFKTAIGFGAVIPLLLLAPFSYVFTVLPWLPFRFSLRTMLIATTVIAVVLGLIVLSMKT